MQLNSGADSAWVMQCLKRAVPAAVVCALAAAASAGALIEPGNIQALPGNPYPAQPGVTVNGTLFTNQPFPPPPATQTPQDYLKFTVANAGETIEFSDQNTTTGVKPNMCSHYCPVYLSVVDQNFKDPGAPFGTFAVYGDTEVIDWTAPAPGTYYMVMESDGDVNVSYAAKYTILSGGGSGGGGCQQNCSPGPIITPPLIRKLRVSPKQSGTKVNAFVKPGQALHSVRMVLLYGKHTISSQTRGPLGTSRYSFTLGLSAAYRRKLKARHKLHLAVRITASGSTGATVTYTRAVTLT
jgi:hypothetical protein